jgi:hypothetical protein
MLVFGNHTTVLFLNLRGRSPSGLFIYKTVVGKIRLNDEYTTEFPSHFIEPLYSSNTANLYDIDFGAIKNISMHNPESTDK